MEQLTIESGKGYNEFVYAVYINDVLEVVFGLGGSVVWFFHKRISGWQMRKRHLTYDK